MRELILTPEAFEDLREASRWYEQRRAGLATAFRGAVASALAHIQSTPFAFPEVAGPFRRVVVRRYPYQVFYVPDEQRVLVVLIFHTARNPQEIMRGLGNH